MDYAGQAGAKTEKKSKALWFVKESFIFLVDPVNINQDARRVI